MFSTAFILNLFAFLYLILTIIQNLVLAAVLLSIFLTLFFDCLFYLWVGDVFSPNYCSFAGWYLHLLAYSSDMGGYELQTFPDIFVSARPLLCLFLRHAH